MNRINNQLISLENSHHNQNYIKYKPQFTITSIEVNHLFRIILLIIVLVSWHPGLAIDKLPVAKNGVMDLEEWDQGKFGAIPLNGQWKILWHQLLNLEDFAQLDAHFLNGESFSLPSYWNTKQEQVAKSGFGFASFILQLKNIPKISGSYSIYQAKFASSGKLSVYCPQQLGKPHWLIEAGRVSQTAELEVPSLARSHVQLDLAGQGSCYVVVIVSNYSHRNGGLNLPIFFGDKNFITKNIYLRRISNYSLIAVFLIIMFFMFP